MIIGIDEVGYGCWAGDLYICSLKFLQEPTFDLFDSKSISAKKRELLFEKIKPISEYKLGIASVDEINNFGLAHAYKLALFRAVEGMNGEFIIDGRKPKYFECQAVIKGDSLIKEISAASIVAKVLRDKYMNDMDQKFPGYDFANNKGYGTKLHQIALKQQGFCKEHRINYNLAKYLI